MGTGKGRKNIVTIFKHFGKPCFSHGCDRKTSIFPALCIVHAIVNPGCSFTIPHLQVESQIKRSLLSSTPSHALSHSSSCTSTSAHEHNGLWCHPDKTWRDGPRLKIALLEGYFQQSCAPASSCCGIAGERKLQRKSRTTQPEVGRRSRCQPPVAGWTLLPLAPWELWEIPFLLKTMGLPRAMEEVVLAQLPRAAKVVC